MHAIKIMAVVVGVCAWYASYAAAEENNMPKVNAKRQQLIQGFDTDKDGKLNDEEMKALMQHLESRRGNKSNKSSQSRPSSQPSGKSSPEAAKKLMQLPADVKVIKDVEYAKVGDKSMLVDIYLPAKTPKPMPVIVWVHGGGWRGGSKEPCQIVSFSGKGYAIVSINYRLTGEAQFPAQINDCKAVVRWVRANADKYGFDPERVGAAGGSAGGHLVALMGTSGDVKELEGDVGGNLKYSSRVKAVCDLCGPTDFLSADYVLDASRNEPDILKRALVLLLGGPWEEHRQAANLASPVYHITKDDPPIMIVHGDADNVIPVKHSQRLYDKLKSAGLDATLEIVNGAGHGVGAYPGVLDKVLAFFDKHLRNEGSKQAKE